MYNYTKLQHNYTITASRFKVDYTYPSTLKTGASPILSILNYIYLSLNLQERPLLLRSVYKTDGVLLQRAVLDYHLVDNRASRCQRLQRNLLGQLFSAIRTLKLANLIVRHGEHTRFKSGRCNSHRQRQGHHHQFCEKCTEDCEIFGKKSNGRAERKIEMIIRAYCDS